MAFQQPTRQAVLRPVRDGVEERQVPTIVVPAAPVDELQAWVLFSPNTYTTTTSGTPSVLGSIPASSQQTAGRSRLSDLGSLHSLNPSNYTSSFAQSAHIPPFNLHPPASSLSRPHDNDDAVMSESGQHDVEDDAELDSLDSHLPEFRSAHINARGQGHTVAAMASASATVNLPAHDGLGSFRLGDISGMGAAVQEHLYAFEQFNPSRVTKRRRESLNLEQLQAENDFAKDVERTRRIEAWRLEHSRVILEDIQKEARRQRDSNLLHARNSLSGQAVTISETFKAAEAGTTWHDQEVDERLLKQLKSAVSHGAGEDEGFLSRITRKFILEVMGIDDRLLSVLFGENFVGDDEQNVPVDLSTSEAPNARSAAATTLLDDAPADDTWQLHMLERIAKELGIFMHSRITSHPGAFSNFAHVQQMPLPYAGLPVIPEALTPPNREMVVGVGEGRTKERVATDDPTSMGTTASSPQFRPTIYQIQPTNTTGRVAENMFTSVPAVASTTTPASPPQGFTQEEWEQDLDVKLVFRYLRSRFFSGASSSGAHAHRHHHMHHHSLGQNGSSTLGMSMQDVATKAARVRQHHPLVGRSAARQASDRWSMPTYRSSVAATPSSPIVGMRPGTPCASQSTRRSARRGSVSSRHSSRHYWDIGGSIGTGSVIASVGPMGSWGEV